MIRRTDGRTNGRAGGRVDGGLEPIRGVAMMGGAHEMRDLEDWSGVTGQEC